MLKVQGLGLDIVSARLVQLRFFKPMRYLVQPEKHCLGGHLDLVDQLLSAARPMRIAFQHAGMYGFEGLRILGLGIENFGNLGFE